MAESKSDYFGPYIKAHSEKTWKFAPLRINRLAAPSECAVLVMNYQNIMPIPRPVFLSAASI